MKRLLPIFLAVCLLLGGCGWMDGSYHRITPHQQPDQEDVGQVEVAGNYLQLRNVLEDMVSAGVDSSVISVADFNKEKLKDSMDRAVQYIRSNYPLGTYAVEAVTYEVGTIGGISAVAVEITYRHSRSELQRIHQVADMEQVQSLIDTALTDFDTELVLLIDNYQPMDIYQVVEDFASANPSVVMETPELAVEIYPDAGAQRVMELKFIYQSSRDSLRTMRDRVQRMFSSAALYVTQDAQDFQKVSQLYAFLMERFDSYQVKTSLTPAYSLLNHGVGDSAAFAEVYAEMCAKAGVECLVVVGTRSGEPWCWNIVLDDGYYYHVDLLACQNQGGFAVRTDNQMADYVWDYSSYPACTGRPAVEMPEETTAPADVSEPAED